MSEKIQSKRSCPACDCNTGGETIYRIEMLMPDSYKISGDYDIVCCEKCGNCYADIIPDEQLYDDYYKLWRLVSKFKWPS